LITPDTNVRFDHCAKPEFDSWRWVDYWEPLNDVVYFKRKVYQKAMSELGVLLATNGIPVKAEGYPAKKNKAKKAKS
jgi:putative (di)nucleoside polyphosphate hydrolase